MPQTPRVRFNFKNLNVQSSVPLLGVINVVARTTKGPFEDPKDFSGSSLGIGTRRFFGYFHYYFRPEWG